MYLLFDIGGTNMRLAVSSDGQAFGDPKIVKTPGRFEDGLERVRSLVHSLVGSQKITAAAGGIAGPLNREKSRLVNAPHLPKWIGKPLKDEFEKIVNAPVYLENDTAMVGLGEATVGAGKNHPIVAYMTVSTGIGGVRIVNGQIDHYAIGFEPGHQIVAVGDETQISEFSKRKLERSESGAEERKLKTKNFLTLENLVSGSAAEQRYHQKPSQITDPEIWDELALWLTIGLNNTIVHWSPDVIVMGGSMIIKQRVIPFDRLEYYLKDLLKIFPTLPKLMKASLGDIGGLHGALTYLQQKLH